MPERSLAQRPSETEWNAEYARKGLIHSTNVRENSFPVDTSFHLKAYRRPVAGAGVLLLKQVMAPVRAQGRFWGVVILAYENQA